MAASWAGSARAGEGDGVVVVYGLCAGSFILHGLRVYGRFDRKDEAGISRLMHYTGRDFEDKPCTANSSADSGRFGLLLSIPDFTLSASAFMRSVQSLVS